MRQSQLLLLLALGVVSHLLIHAFSLQLAAAGRKAVRLVTTPRRATATPLVAPVPPAAEQTPTTISADESSAPAASTAELAGAAAEARGALTTANGGPIVEGCSGGGFAAPADFAGDEPITARRVLNVLLIHEHHLKAIGSDLRLLGVLMQLRSLGHTASVSSHSRADGARGDSVTGRTCSRTVCDLRRQPSRHLASPPTPTRAGARAWQGAARAALAAHAAAAPTARLDSGWGSAALLRRAAAASRHLRARRPRLAQRLRAPRLVRVRTT